MFKAAVRDRREVAAAAAVTRRAVAVEGLEPRRLLAADFGGPVAPAAEGDELGTLVPTLLASFPSTALAGGKVKGAVATVNITNVGDAYSGPVTVTLFASTDAALDTAADAAITTVTKKLKIDSADSKSVRVNVKSFPNVADGDYLVIAQVSSPTVASGINATDETIRIAAPFTDLSGTLAPIPAKPVVEGKRARLTLNVTNTGNVDAKGPTEVTIAVATEGSTTVTLATVSAKLAVKPGATKAVKLNFTVPTDSPSGSFFVNTTIGTFPNETNTANNTALSDTTLAIA